ncbi:MAG: hypothetical protein LC790_20555 [Actinobacteria bacterium]|nr:hypothetical protein [Actinomycetota bacterium]
MARCPHTRADQVLTAQRDLDHDPSRFKAHRAHPDPVQAQQTRECRREAHVVLPEEPLDLNHQAASLTAAAAPHPSCSCARRPVNGATTRLAALGPDGPPLTARLRSAEHSSKGCASRATHANDHAAKDACSRRETQRDLTHIEYRRR